MAKEQHKHIRDYIPNEETIKAIEEARNGKLEEITNLDEWLDNLLKN